MNSNGWTSDGRSADRTRGQKPRNEKTREKTTRHVTPTIIQQKKNPHKEKQKKIRMLGAIYEYQGEPLRAVKQYEE